MMFSRHHEDNERILLLFEGIKHLTDTDRVVEEHHFISIQRRE
jgi:hypothetical protein